MSEEWTEADDVIEEVREVRRKIFARFGNDPQRLAEHYIELDRHHPGPRIEPPAPGGTMSEEWTEADDVIEEIHEVRRQLWARFDNDIDRIAEYYLSLDKAQPERPIEAPPRPNPGKSAA